MKRGKDTIMRQQKALRLPTKIKLQRKWGFLGDPVVKNSPYNAGDTGLIPGPG